MVGRCCLRRTEESGRDWAGGLGMNWNSDEDDVDEFDDNESDVLEIFLDFPAFISIFLNEIFVFEK